MVDGFEHAALSLGPEARRSYLESVKGEIDEVIQVQHVAARVSAGCFAIVIRDYVDRGSLVDLMRALELALLWKGRIDGRQEDVLRGSLGRRALPGGRRRSRRARRTYGVAAGA